MSLEGKTLLAALVTLTCIVLGGAGGILLSSCSPPQIRDTLDDALADRKGDLWKVLDKGQDHTHPMYVAKEAFTLLDGTQVTCVAHKNGLWCKEMGSSDRPAAQAPKTQTPETLSEELDFGG